MSSDYLYHMVLTHLYRVGSQCREQTAHTVADDTIDSEPVALQLLYAIQIIRDAFVTHKSVPQYFVPECIFYYYKSEMTPPVGGVHIYDDILVTGYNMNVSHLLEPFPYGPYRQGIFFRKLAECLFVVDIICYYPPAICLSSSDELTAAVKTSVQLILPSSAILLYMRRMAPFTLFYS